MDQLEQYLDKVCRGIGGPVEMRNHVRQELREHLLDAVAQHKAAGLADEAALEKALAEFGQPEEVRSDLEAAHGQRMTWILDKAMHWKEMTMKAKWLWMTWAYVAMALVIALALTWICFADVFLVPKYQKLLHDGIIDRAILDDPEVAWMPAFLIGVRELFAHSTTWIMLLAVAAAGLFEWRVKSENKPWIRLSALGTVAVGLMVLGILMAGALVISFELGVPAMGRLAQPFALEQVATIDTTMNALEQALAKKEWAEVEKQAELASGAMTRLGHGPALASLTWRGDGPRLDELRARMKEAQENLRDARTAITAKDAERVHGELARLRKAIEPVREAAKKSAP